MGVRSSSSLYIGSLKSLSLVTRVSYLLAYSAIATSKHLVYFVSPVGYMDHPGVERRSRTEFIGSSPELVVQKDERRVDMPSSGRTLYVNDGRSQESDVSLYFTILSMTDRKKSRPNEVRLVSSCVR